MAFQQAARRLRVPFAGLVTAFIVLVFVGLLDSIEIRRHRSETAAEVQRQVSAVRAPIEGLLNRRLYLVRVLQVCVAQKPDITQTDFERVAQDLIAGETSIPSMSLAKDNIISHVYPYEANRQALGVNLLELPGQRSAVLQAIKSDSSWLAGPTPLVQGGIGDWDRRG
jgi:sensor domain CHASE-containing protein